MARYYGGSSGPADWAAMQVQRRDDQIRDLLNMMMQIKDYRNEQAWKQKEWERGAETQDLNRRLTEAQIANYNEVPVVRAPAPSALQEKAALLESNPDLYYKLFPKSEETEKPSGESKARDAFIKGVISKYEKAEEALSKGDNLGLNSSELDNIRSGGSLLVGIENKLARGEPLTGDDWDAINKLNDINVVKKRGLYWIQPTTPPATPLFEPKGLVDWAGGYNLSPAGAGTTPPTAPASAVPQPPIPGATKAPFMSPVWGGEREAVATATAPTSFAPAVEKLARTMNISKERALGIYQKWLAEQIKSGVSPDKLLKEMNKY